MTYGPPLGRLVVHSSFNPMAFLLAFTGPRVIIDGQAPAKVKWGQAAFDLPAGNHYVRVSTRYLGDMGPAELPVTIHPGQLTTVYYRPPAAMGMKGALGFQPQKTRGMSVVMVLNVVVILAAILFIILTISL